MRHSIHDTKGFNLFLLIFAAILWGTIGIATGILYRTTDTNALSIAFLRMAIASPVLFLTCVTRFGRQTWQVAASDLALMLLLGLAMALYQIFYFVAIARIGVMIAALLTLCTAPIIIILLSTTFLGEKLTRQVLQAVVMALLGTILLVGAPAPINSMQQLDFFGIILALLSAVAYATVTLCSRLLANRYPPLQSITIGFTASTIILLPFALATGLVLSYSPSAWLWLLHLGLLPTAFAYLLFFYALRHLTAMMAGIIMLVEPLTSTILAWLLFGEQLSPLGLLGAMLLLGTIGLLYQAEGTPSRSSDYKRDIEGTPSRSSDYKRDIEGLSSLRAITASLLAPLGLLRDMIVTFYPELYDKKCI